MVESLALRGRRGPHARGTPRRSASPSSPSASRGRRGAPRERTYGFRRAEVLAAFANGVALALTAIWIFIEAAHRWRTRPGGARRGADGHRGRWGSLVNVVAALLLSTGEHGHNINTRAALAHVLSDALGSVGAIAAGVLILAFGWTRADPADQRGHRRPRALGRLAARARDTSQRAHGGQPDRDRSRPRRGHHPSVPGVVDLHDLHVWSISDGFNVLTVHVVLARGHHGTNVAAAVARRLRAKHALTTARSSRSRSRKSSS